MQSTFKRKIIILFIVLLVTMGMLFVKYMYNSYEDLQEVSVQYLAADVSKITSDLIGSLQKERELGAQLLMSVGEKSIKQKLQERYSATDKLLDTFLQYDAMQSPEKHKLMMLVESYNSPHRKRLKKLIARIAVIRDRVQHAHTSLHTLIQYYRALNRELLEVLHGLLWLTRNQYAYGIDIHRLLWVKEYASLERVFVENLLLSRQYLLSKISLIREMISAQKSNMRAFVTSLSPRMRTQYRHTVHAETLHKLQTLRKALLFQYRLNYTDAPRWWQTSGLYLGELDQFLQLVTQKYMKRLQYKKDQIVHERILFWVLGVFVLLAMGVLVYYLQRLLQQEEKLLEDLRIASFAFNSHEGMAITDAEGTIIKINHAFSTITGYRPDEILGHNTRILKSGRHSEEFYDAMWHKLTTEGHWSGEIINRRKNGEEYHGQLSISAIKNDHGETTHYIVQFLDISELKAMEREARHQAAHDPLTHLPNRRSMLKKLTSEHARARRHHFYNAFFFIDVDDFKRVNDVYGHAVGDQLLVAIAERLRNSVRSEDYTARISGDEFCIILTHIAHEKREEAIRAARHIAAKLFENLEPPYVVNGTTLHAHFSVGVTLFPDQDKTIDAIIRDADAAMYHAKKMGKNRFVFFDHTIEKQLQKLEQMEHELQLAFAHDEILFYYQPKVCTQTDRIIGAELLMRWRHPERDLLYPGMFIDGINSASLMSEVTRRALEEACRFITKASGLFVGTLTINLPTHALRSDREVREIQEIITRFGVDPSRIEFDLFEDEVIDNFEAVVARIDTLKRFGVRFALDNFGVGYSSIHALKSIPAEVIKIDRTFTNKLDEERTQKLVKLIIGFAKVFGLKVLLEGVENPYQLDFARKESVEMYQGFLFSEAVDSATFHKMLREEA